MKSGVTVLAVLFLWVPVFSQQEAKRYSLGFCYGFGDEMRQTDYRFSNHFVKVQLAYRVLKRRHFDYVVVVQPEVNFGKHQLLNKYFVKPDTPDYEALRERYTQLKNVREYILNVGVMLRKPITKTFSVYLLGSVGPMITDTETERLSKGFTFSDVIALGFSFRADSADFDIRPSLRHVSNANLQATNSGFNTQNIEICLTFDL